MTKPLFLIVAPSGTGKTTLADMLEEKCGLRQVASYTTRPPRSENEKGHTFISDEEYDALDDIVAFTDYNNHRYCATASQLDKSQVYVVDIPGVESMLRLYKSNRKVIIFYLSASVHTKITRMKMRGDSDSKILNRIHNDHECSWLEELEKVTDGDERTKIIFIDANKDKDKVFKDVLDYVNIYNK